MTAQHARPLVAYLCVALVAALLLAQGVVPRDVPGVSGVIGGVSSLHLGTDVVLSPLQGQDDVAVVGVAVPRRVVEQRSVIRAAAPAPAARPRAASTVRPRATGSVQSVRPRTHQPKAPRASRTAPKAVRPGKSRVLANGHGRTSLVQGHARTSPSKGSARTSPSKGSARTSPSKGSARASLRSSPRDARASQRAGQRAKGHGRASGRR